MTGGQASIARARVPVEGRERTRITEEHAQRLWGARDDARISRERVEYDGCLYDRDHSASDEFSMGSSLLDDGQRQMLMAYGRDALSDMLEAVTAHQLARRLDPRTPEQLAAAARLARRTGVARLEDTPAAAHDALGRVLLQLVTDGDPRLDTGGAVVRIRHGLSLHLRDMIVWDHILGSTTIPPRWAGKIERVLDERRAADPPAAA